MLGGSFGEGEVGGSSAPALAADAGLVPRAVAHLFARAEGERAAAAAGGEYVFGVTVSCLEVYNESVCDLLRDGAPELAVREDTKGHVFAGACHTRAGAQQRARAFSSRAPLVSAAAPFLTRAAPPRRVSEGAACPDVADAAATCALFARAAASRAVGATAANRESSRSHALFTVALESKARLVPGAGAWRRRSGTLHLVDLAGSERQRASEAAGQRLKEAAAINKSLSALGNVIKALVDIAAGRVGARRGDGIA